MVQGLVLVTQIGLVALLLLLAFRMHRLTQTEPLTPGCDAAPVSGVVPAGGQRQQRVTAVGSENASLSRQSRTELFTQIHILAGLQDRDCRDKGLNLGDAPQAVKAYAAAWLYGAGCALCDKSQRHSDGLADLVAQLASRKTGLRGTDATAAIARLTSCSVLLACFRAGLEGAEHWREHHFVPRDHSLYDVVTNNAFI